MGCLGVLTFLFPHFRLAGSSSGNKSGIILSVVCVEVGDASRAYSFLIQGGQKSASLLSTNFSKMVKDTKMKLSHLKENRVTNYMISNL